MEIHHQLTNQRHILLESSTVRLKFKKNIMYALIITVIKFNHTLLLQECPKGEKNKSELSNII